MSPKGPVQQHPFCGEDALESHPYKSVLDRPGSLCGFTPPLYLFTFTLSFTISPCCGSGPQTPTSHGISMRQAEVRGFAPQHQGSGALHRDKLTGNRCGARLKSEKQEGWRAGRGKSDKTAVISLCQHCADTAQLWMKGRGQCSDLTATRGSQTRNIQHREPK